MVSEAGDMTAEITAGEEISKSLFGGMKDSSASWYVAMCTKRVGRSQNTSSHSLHLLLLMSIASKLVAPRSSMKL